LDATRTISGARRNCSMCFTYRNFKPDDDRKNAVLKALDELYNAYRLEFDSLRRADASEGEIIRARENKTFMLNATDTCKACGRDEDKINRLLMQIK